MIIFFLVFLLPCHVPSQNVPRNISIFILAGQSNMAGRGGVYNDTATNTTVWDGVVPPQCQPSPSILRLTAKLKWEEANEPLHGDIDVNKTNGVGPGMPFAKRVLNREPRFGSVGLVPCAIGGTNISQWQKGGFLYERTVTRAKTAAAGGGGYTAVLWYQGESDTVDAVDAGLYKERLVKFFTDLRSDLQNPTLPIIQVALTSGSGPYVDEVRQAQLETDLVNVRCVDAKGLPLEPGGLHLTTSAQVQLGQMMADAFMAIPNSTSLAPEKSFSGLCLFLLFSLFSTYLYGPLF